MPEKRFLILDELTDLDRAHWAMIRDPEDDAARLAYYHRFADAEVYLLLDSEPAGDAIDPATVVLEDGLYVLVFDREERLAEFTQGPAPYAALPGRVIVGQLGGQALGIGINLGGSEGAFLMPPEAVDWLADALTRAPEAGGAAPLAYFAPTRPEMAPVFAQKLAGLGALAACAHLSGARLAAGIAGHVLVFEDAHPGAHDALAKAASEAILFSNSDPEGFEVMFMTPAQISRAGLLGMAMRIEISVPAEEKVAPAVPAAPGSDPAKPPRLR